MPITRSVVTSLFLSALVLGACSAPDEPTGAGDAAIDDVASVETTSEDPNPNPACLDQTQTIQVAIICNTFQHKFCQDRCTTDYYWSLASPGPGLPPLQTCKKGATTCERLSCGPCVNM